MTFRQSIRWVMALVLVSWSTWACKTQPLSNGMPSEISCSTCHGSEQSPAPPPATNGATATTEIEVGAHQQHLGESSIRSGVSCAECHVVPATVDAPGHMDGPHADVVFGDLAKTQNVTPTWDRGNATCSSVYCHGATLSGGQHSSPVWITVDNSQNRCDSCHGYPPPPPHAASSQCSLCHGQTVQADGTINVAAGKHINGQMEVSGLACTACHGSGQDPAPPLAVNGSSSTSGIGVGAHQQHLRDSSIRSAVKCAECHVVPATVGASGHINGDHADVVFGELAKSQNVSPAWNRDSATCSSVYCHGATQSGGQHPSPVWTTVDDTQDRCDSCHGNPPPPPHVVSTQCSQCHGQTTRSDGTIDVAAGKHINGQLEVSGLACNACHGDQDSPAPPVDTLGNSATSYRGVGAHRSHLRASNWRATVACSQCHLVPSRIEEPGHNDSPLPADMIWGPLATAGGANPSFDGSTCSNVYCHGSTLRPGGSNTRPVWTTVNGSQAACGTCHGLPPGGTHPNQPDCETCHGEVIADDHVFIAPQRHMDGRVDTSGNGHHPDGYDDPGQHDLDFKLGVSDCRNCHGSDLTGQGAAESCDSCHAAGWRTNCTFCHGGTDNQTGAPPVDLRGNIATSNVTVGSHSRHLARTNHPTWNCAQCHPQVADLLTPGHVFDSTPGMSEVVFAGGLSSAGSYARSSGCSNIYCHGNGRTNGRETSFAGTAKNCNSCHASSGLGGEHSTHLEQGIGCATCHSAVASSNSHISNPDLHVNGNKDVHFSSGGTFNSSTKTCSGIACHGSEHW